MAITYEKIKAVNDVIDKVPIKGKDYAQVNDRVKAFRQLCPEGSIETEIISLENGVVTMKSVIKDENGKILSTGMAQEKESSSFINKTSFIENCETSSVGRALGFAGIGVDGSMASAEEIANAVLNQEQPAKQTKKNAKAESKTDEQKNAEMVASVDEDFVPHGEGMTPKRIARLKKAQEFCKKNDATVLATAKAKSFEEITEVNYIAVMNLFFKLMTPEQKKEIEAI